MSEPDQQTLEAWERLWPVAGFVSREAWLAYCAKWWARLSAFPSPKP